MSAAFQFEPHQTRNAIMRITQLFPPGQRAPLGLKELFDRLARMDMDQLAHYADEIQAVEVDLLSEFYHHAKRVEVLMGVALVLAFRRDKRAAEVLAHFFFQIPEEELCERVAGAWSLLSLELKLPNYLNWLGIFFGQPNPPDPVDFVVDRLRKGWFRFDDLGDGFFQTPLFRKLAYFLFADGAEFIHYIQPEHAATWAKFFLAADDDLRVRTYLSRFPTHDLQPRFLEDLYSKKGRPDPVKYPFFKELDQAVIWSIRQRLFQARLGQCPLGKTQQVWWMERLHYCQDWQIAGEVIHITMRPLKLVVMGEQTLVAMLAEPRRAIHQYPHDHEWEKNMDNLMRKHFGW